MLVPGVLFVLILAGCWVYCLIDAALTPSMVFRGLPKAAWICVIAVTFAVGSIAWLAYRTMLYRKTKPGPKTSRAKPGRPKPRLAPGYATGSDAPPAHTYVFWHPDWAAAEASVARHPAGRFRNIPAEGWTGPKGPDDDPDFLRELDRRIKGTSAEDPD